MLPRINRLPAQDIPLVLRGGMHIRDASLEFVYKKMKMDPDPLRRSVSEASSKVGMTNVSRFAVIVSTKIDKRATTRNRMKRLVREALGHLLPSIQENVDGVFVIRGKLPDGEVEVESLVFGILLREKLLKDFRGV